MSEPTEEDSAEPRSSRDWARLALAPNFAWQGSSSFLSRVWCLSLGHFLLPSREFRFFFLPYFFGSNHIKQNLASTDFAH